MKDIARMRRLNSLRRMTVSVAVAAVAGVFVTATVYAAVSFKGEGKIPFDAISTGSLQLSGTGEIKGKLTNPTTGQPVIIADSLKVKGDLNVLGTVKNTTTDKPVKIDDSLQVTKNANFLGTVKNTTANKPFKVDDGLQVTGNGDVLGTMKNTGTNKPFKVDDNMQITGDLTIDGDLNSDLTVALSVVSLNTLAYLSCVADAAQYTTYLESEDTIDCWNYYIAGSAMMANPGDTADKSGEIGQPGETWPTLEKK